MWSPTAYALAPSARADSAARSPECRRTPDGSRPGAAGGLRGDVGIRVEAVAGSVRRLSPGGRVVVRAVGRGDGVLRLVVAGIVEPAAGAEVRAHRRERLPAQAMFASLSAGSSQTD